MGTAGSAHVEQSRLRISHQLCVPRKAGGATV